MPPTLKRQQHDDTGGYGRSIILSVLGSASGLAAKELVVSQVALDKPTEAQKERPKQDVRGDYA